MPLSDRSGSRHEVLIVVSHRNFPGRRSPAQNAPASPVLTGNRFWITVCTEGQESKGSNPMNVAQVGHKRVPAFTSPGTRVASARCETKPRIAARPNTRSNAHDID